jgi:hypothetical protein
VLDETSEDGQHSSGLLGAAAKRLSSESRRWPEELFRFAATDFLRTIGRLASSPPATPGRYDREIEDFVAVQQEGRWPSEATCRAGRWRVGRFVMHLEQQGIALGDVEPADGFSAREK